MLTINYNTILVNRLVRVMQKIEKNKKNYKELQVQNPNLMYVRILFKKIHLTYPSLARKMTKHKIRQIYFMGEVEEDLLFIHLFIYFLLLCKNYKYFALHAILKV